MEQIKDNRRNVLVHPNSSEDDLPITGLPELPGVANGEPFVPEGMKSPNIYPGDVIIGIRDEEVQFAELIYKKLDDGVLVVALDSGEFELIADGAFSSRFYKADEVHVYDGAVEEAADWDVEFDISSIERPEQGRAR